MAPSHALHQPFSAMPHDPIPTPSNGDSIPDTALQCVFSYIHSPPDRSSISLVSLQWYRADCHTRKDITIACCYAVEPSSLTRRFKALQAVKLTGKPRASMFRPLPDDWGGYAGPWISEIAVNCESLKSIHLKRMIVSDEDLFTLARERGHVLQVLKLHKCSGFSTTGLEAVTRSCRLLRVLFLDGSSIEDHGGKWLHELALHNSSLEVLNFYRTDLQHISMADLETLAMNCKALSSLKFNKLDLKYLGELLSRTTALRELGGISVGPSNGQQSVPVNCPTTLTSLVGLHYTGDDGDGTLIPIIQPVASGLKNMDLRFACLSVDGCCQLVPEFINLEALEVPNYFGEDGLELIANNCRKLRKLRVARNTWDWNGFISARALISGFSKGHHLEYISVYTCYMNNAAFKTVAQNCPNLKDFRLLLADESTDIAEYPLDEGVIALMQGCSEMQRLGLYLRHGLVTDQCMEQIGKYGQKLRWLHWGSLGETELGFSLFADGCPNLERLEIRGCIFTEACIAMAVLKMASLKFVWVQGYKSTATGHDLLPLKCAYWNVEFIPGAENLEAMEFVLGDEIGYGDETPKNQPQQFIAYRSLRGHRKDAPETVIFVG